MKTGVAGVVYLTFDKNGVWYLNDVALDLFGFGMSHFLNVFLEQFQADVLQSMENHKFASKHDILHTEHIHIYCYNELEF